MIVTLVRYFIYGFVLFAGVWAIVDMPFYLEGEEPIWGYLFAIKWGVVGGFNFLVAYGSWRCLKAMVIGLIKQDAG
jgi:hypothetical protein